ncbi:MAG: OFA family MFS transporter [Deltaproteobacteria bacterium]|jgi:OFA family oxalate/formate antiporter-like MFS transporter|nr:OFA family MFS transporter [Deltaproteobacteria bacterium]
MTDQKIMNRWFVAIGAIFIQLALGAIYAWSVFTPYLEDANWTKTQTQAVFAAGLAFFAIVMVIAGRLMPKVGPRILALAGGIILGLGYFLAGYIAPYNFYSTLFFIGIMGGSGIGLAYVVPIACGMKWFPDKKGLITGLAVAGFGFGATLWVKLAGSWGGLLAKTSLGTTFMIYGGIFLAMVFIGGIFMVFPPEGYVPAGWDPEAHENSKTNKNKSTKANLKTGAMLKTPQFYMIFITFLFGAAAGLMAIGLMKAFPSIALQENGIDGKAALAIAGTAMGVFYALANGLGRIAWGVISDKLGRKVSLVIMTASQGIIVILFPYMAGTPYLLYIGATLIGFNFGGNFSLFPTITSETFGAKYIGQNYGWVFLAYGVGGIGGPIMGGKLGDMGNFPLAFTIAGGLCLVGAIIVAFVKPVSDE